jgi:hypothetical protein
VGTLDAEGGCIHVEKADLNMSWCTFANCESSNTGGGAISFSGKTLRLEHTSFLTCISNNNSINSYGNDIQVGGALRMYCYSVTIGAYCVNCTFLNCRSNLHGGAIGIANDGTPLTRHYLNLEDCIFVSNYGAIAGGAVDVMISCNCTRCSFLDNYSGKNGSAIRIYYLSHVYFDECVFIRNIIGECTDPAQGGTICVHLQKCPSSGNIYFNISNCIFNENEMIDCEDGFYFILFYLFFYFIDFFTSFIFFLLFI